MSIKIYEGYRLAQDTDIWEFTERIRKAGNERRDQLDTAILEKFAQKNAEKRREAGKKAAPTREAYLMGGYQGYREITEVYKSEGLDPTGMSLTFIRDPVSARILVRSYCGNQMSKVFTEQPDVEYFGYWDNSDPDDSCTEAEWAEREASWRRTTGLEAPIRHGINFELRAGPDDGLLDLIYRETEHSAVNG